MQARRGHGPRFKNASWRCDMKNTDNSLILVFLLGAFLYTTWDVRRAVILKQFGDAAFFALLAFAMLFMLTEVAFPMSVTCKPQTYGSGGKCSDGTTWKEDRYDYGKTLRGSDGTVCTRGNYSNAVTCKAGRK